jgi:hypothetical protein
VRLVLGTLPTVPARRASSIRAAGAPLPHLLIEGGWPFPLAVFAAPVEVHDLAVDRRRRFDTSDLPAARALRRKPQRDGRTRQTRAK